MLCDKLCLAAILLLSNASLAAATPDRSANTEAPLQPESYTQLLNVLTSGRSVMVTTNFNQCTVVGTSASGPQITGGLQIRDYIVPENKYIAFSNVHDTLGPDNERVTEYTRYRVMPDGKVSIRFDTLRAGDGKVLKQTEYLCTLDKSVVFHWFGNQ